MVEYGNPLFWAPAEKAITSHLLDDPQYKIKQAVVSLKADKTGIPYRKTSVAEITTETRNLFW